jgi:hypothetical protein
LLDAHPDRPYRRMFNVIQHEWIIKGDFVVRKDDRYRRTEFERRREIMVQGTPLDWPYLER